MIADAYLRADLLRANVMSDLTRERQAIEATVDRLLHTVTNGAECARQQLDLSLIDLQQLVASALPWVSERPFALLSVRGGLIVEKQGGTYDVTITGRGIGGLGEDSLPRWTVAGTTLAAGDAISNVRHEVTLRIPSAVLTPLFQDHTVVLVPVEVEGAATVVPLLSRKICEARRYRSEFRIALMPRYAATVESVSTYLPGTVSSYQPVTSPSGAPKPCHVATAITGQPSGQRQPVVQNCTLPAGARVDRIDMDCKPGHHNACGFCYNPASVDPSRNRSSECTTVDGPGGVVVTCQITCDPGILATISHDVYYSVPGPPPAQKVNVAIEADAARLRHAESLAFVLPVGSNGNYEIEGATASGARFHLYSAARQRLDLGITSDVEDLPNQHRVLVTAVGLTPHVVCN